MNLWPVIQITRMWPQGERGEAVKARFGTGEWRITDLREVVKDEPVFDLPLAFLDLGALSFNIEDNGGLIEFARHMKHVIETSLDHPIIIDEWGQPIDGRHRIVRALIEGRPTIKAVRVPQGTVTTGRAPA